MLRDYLIEYSNDVIDGKIIACQKHKWACQRFIRDIEREGTDFVFSEEKAIRFLQWMSLFKHTKGKLQGKNIEPHEIQIFNFSNIYGWVHKDTGLRRFRKAYWQVGRKNAKSQSLACVGSYEAMALGELMAEVYIGATKAEQSRIVWNEIQAQIRGCEFLRGKFKVAYKRIEHPKSDSTISALSKDAGKSGDGLHIQCAIIDEYHAHTTSEIYDVLVSGMGARTQPLMMIITTAGFDLSHPCYSVEYKYVSQILDPDSPIENDEYFVMINELDKDDDIQDYKVWEKANPILCSYEEGRKYIQGELKAALDVPEKMRNFLTKNMNIWVDQKDNGFMPLNKWAACAGDMPEFEGKECYVGVDLSAKIDLTSVTFEFPLGDNMFAVLSHSFMPEDTVRAKSKTDRAPYRLWIEQGWITQTPGAVVDYQFVMEYIKRTAEENGWHIAEICCDPWNASQFMNDMDADGYVTVEIRQGYRTLAGPTKHIRELVMQGNLFHDGNPVLAWAMGNAVVRQDANENIMLDKSKASGRIDPAASLVCAHVRAMVSGADSSVYEERGVLSL